MTADLPPGFDPQKIFKTSQPSGQMLSVKTEGKRPQNFLKSGLRLPTKLPTLPIELFFPLYKPLWEWGLCGLVARTGIEPVYLSRILKATESASARENTAPLVRLIVKRIDSLDQRATKHFRNLFAHNKSLVGKLGKQKDDILKALGDHAKELGEKIEKTDSNITRLRDEHAEATKVTQRELKSIKKGITQASPLSSYFKSLQEQFSIYENVGLPVFEPDSKEGEKDVEISIRKLFVPATCTGSHYTPEAFHAQLLAKINPAEPFIPFLGSPKSRTVLLADPGMGKSTIVQWLISTLADGDAPEGAPPLRGSIPFPFILRDLVPLLPEQLEQWDWDALVNAFRRYRPRDAGGQPLPAPLCSDSALLHSLFSSDHAFFLIDGLDEIGDVERRKAVRNAIWQGMDRHPDSRWLVTSRIVGYDLAPVHLRFVPRLQQGSFTSNPMGSDVRMHLPQGKELSVLELDIKKPSAPEEIPDKVAALFYLAPFDNDQQKAFARNWFLPRLGKVAGEARVTAFLRDVQRHGHTAVISRVPNLLYLLALLYRHKAHLPNGRALVYDAIAYAYLFGIDIERHLPDGHTVPFNLPEKEELLATIAIEMQHIRAAQDEQTRGEVLATRKQLAEWLRPRFGSPDDVDASKELARFLDHIARRSGLLLPRGEDQFGFAHLSFLEYFAACHLKGLFRRILNQKARGHSNTGLFGKKQDGIENQPGEHQFAEMASQTAWHESLNYLVEKLRDNADDTATLLSWIFPSMIAGPLEKDKPPMPLPAAQLLAALSNNQDVSLSFAQRQAIWTTLWQAHIAQQPYEPWQLRKWHLSPSLLVANDFQPEVLQSLFSLEPQKLCFDDCTSLSDLKPLSALGSLRSLSLSGCTSLSDLKPLSALGSLQSLYLNRCTSLSDLKPLFGLGSLQSLSLTGCTSLSDLKPLSRLGSLQSLSLSGCTSLSDLKPLSALGSLRSLSLSGCTSLSDLKPLSALGSLQSLYLNRCTSLSDLKPLSALGSLRSLSLDGCTSLSDLKPLSRLGSLRSLSLDGCTSLNDLKPLSGLGSLQSLSLNGYISLSDLKPLSGLGSLQSLSLNGCTSLSDLEPLSELGSLQSLSLNRCTSLNDLEPLSGLGSLQSLSLDGCTSLSDLELLSGLGSLRSLSLTGCTLLSDLKPLSGLGSLQSLYLDGCTSLSDLKPLSGLGSLQSLYLDGSINITDESEAALRKSLPQLSIFR